MQLFNNLWNQYKNPYYYWWKVRKYWKIPKLHLYHIGKITWFYGMPVYNEYYNKYLDIHISGLGWKDKEGSPRFEWNPYFCITLLRKWQIILTWSFCPHFLDFKDPTHSRLSNEMTWEVILSMVHYDKNIADACHFVGFWEDYIPCDDPDYRIPSKQITPFRNMTKYGFEQYYKVPRSKQLKTTLTI